MENIDNSEIVVSTLRKIIRAVDLQSKKLTKEYGLTGPQLLVLKEIQKEPERSISAIAKSISLSQATVTIILDRIEQQGFAKRCRSVQDKRKVNIILTEKAQAILESNPSLLQEEFSSKFEKLEEWEKSMMLSSLQRLATMLNVDKITSQNVLQKNIAPPTF